METQSEKAGGGVVWPAYILKGTFGGQCYNHLPYAQKEGTTYLPEFWLKEETYKKKRLRRCTQINQSLLASVEWDSVKGTHVQTYARTRMEGEKGSRRWRRKKGVGNGEKGTQ